MADLQELMRQKADLERQIAQAQSQSRNDAIARIRALMAESGLTLADLSTSAKRAPTASGGARKTVAAKYKDDAGNQWSGRGLKPKWLTGALKSGKKLEDFAV